MGMAGDLQLHGLVLAAPHKLICAMPGLRTVLKLVLRPAAHQISEPALSLSLSLSLFDVQITSIGDEGCQLMLHSTPMPQQDA